MRERGCGVRHENAVYLCAGGHDGMAIEHFMFDPPIPWTGPHIRGPMLHQDRKGIYHIILGIGKKFYPTVPDFVEEGTIMGISKRIPLTFFKGGDGEAAIDKLTPGKSKLFLIHPNAIPLFEYNVFHDCPIEKLMPREQRDAHKQAHLKWMSIRDAKTKIATQKQQCIGGLWSLAAVHPRSKKHIVEDVGVLPDVGNWKRVSITTPSTSYTVTVPKSPKAITPSHRFHAGVILLIHEFHFEYVKKDGKAPKALKERATKKGFAFEVREE